MIEYVEYFIEQMESQQWNFVSLNKLDFEEFLVCFKKNRKTLFFHFDYDDKLIGQTEARDSTHIIEIERSLEFTNNHFGIIQTPRWSKNLRSIEE